ncbi:MAG: lipid-A-disaccharide synthase N-terminal domain-containing protein [Lentisphaerae bacterium]|nr:lipid-A-disaccharide synthase N-terminal domain-containing protein [Lentisphaerota bacterium]
MHPLGALGLIGQCLFFSRFLLQWVVSEKRRESTMPVGFWYLSLAGGVLVFSYALWRRDPVITLGQSVGIFVYTRNLVLIYRKRRAHAGST